MRKKEDRRTTYSKKLIRETLINLLKEKDLNSISVSEICEIADINRGTFYHYYDDIYDLIESIIEYDMNIIDSLLQKHTPFNNNSSTLIDDLVDNSELHKDILCLKISPQIFSMYLTKLYATIRPHIETFVETHFKNLEHHKKVTFSTYFVGGMTSVIMTWLNGSIGITKEEVKADLTEFITTFISKNQ